LRAPCTAPRSSASGLRRLPCGTPHSGHLPPRQARRCRRRFRTTTTERTRTPSLGSTRTLRPEQARRSSLFACTASPRTRSLAASLGLPRQRPTGRFELSGVFTSPRGLRLAAREAPERCVSPTSATDSRHEHPADCSVPGCARFRAPTLRWSHGSPRALRPAETNADSPWALTRRRRGVGALPFRLPDEPTKWSFA